MTNTNIIYDFALMLHILTISLSERSAKQDTLFQRKYVYFNMIHFNYAITSKQIITIQISNFSKRKEESSLYRIDIVHVKTVDAATQQIPSDSPQ